MFFNYFFFCIKDNRNFIKDISNATVHKILYSSRDISTVQKVVNLK